MKLRAIEADDLPALYEHQLDPEGNAMAMMRPRTWENFQADLSKAMRDADVTARAVMADGKLAGMAACFQRDGADMVGYWIGREHWGRGIATQAVVLLLKEVTRRPLRALVARSNAASLRVLERNGFKIVGYKYCAGDERYLACEEAHLELRGPEAAAAERADGGGSERG